MLYLYCFGWNFINVGVYVLKFFFCIVFVIIECYLNFIKKVIVVKLEEEFVFLK